MSRHQNKPPRIAIAVLGELASSTRMLQHARCALENGFAVELIGHYRQPLPEALLAQSRLKIRALPIWQPTGRHRWPLFLYLVYLGLRLLLDSVGLLWVLLSTRADALLIQTPPALPTLPLACLCTILKRQRLLIDWHNLGYTLTALRLGQGHALTRLAKWLERRTARCRHARHLAVTQALSEHLQENWQLPAVTVLHDGLPTPHPARSGRGALYAAIPALADTTEHPGPVMICPSSWSADDDLDLLLNTLPSLDQRLVAECRSMLLILSGDGPRRAEFEAQLTALSLHAMTVRCVWVPLQQYPDLLASADIGLSLHRSASGLDLPMKLFEMQAADLYPILALAAGGPFGELPLPGLSLFEDNQQLIAQLLNPPSRPVDRPTAPRPWCGAWQATIPRLLT